MNTTLLPSPRERRRLLGRCVAIRIALILLLSPGVWTIDLRAQNVSIGTTSAASSALLHLGSTAMGLLIPRMTDAQMRTITTPATGDLVYDSTYTNFYYYTGSYWTPMVGSGWSLTGDAGTSPSTNFLGSKDAVDVVQRTNAIERLRFYSAGDIGLTNSTNTAGRLLFYEPSGSGTYYTAIKAGPQAGNVHYVLPTADGTTNAAMITDGTANLSWHIYSTFGGGGSTTLWSRGSAAGGENGVGASNSSSAPYAIAAGISSSVTGNYDIGFGNSISVSGTAGTVSGGSSNSSTGNDDVTGGGQNNSVQATATNANGGKSNSPQGDYSAILGGNGNSISATNCTILGGTTNSIGGNYEMCYGSGISVGTQKFIVFKTPGTNTTRFGIGTQAPSQMLDVAGNLRFSGSLKPNNAGGSSGQYLLSAGSGVVPTWGSATFSSNNWGLTGTSGMNPATNFVGTTDAQDLVVRTNASVRCRILSAGQIGVNTSISTAQLSSIITTTTDETAGAYGNASGSTATQAIGAWGRVGNTGATNTGTVAVLATGNGNATTGTTNAAAQISQGELTMGRTTQTPSVGTVLESATAGTLYTAQGPSGVIQLSLQTDLSAVAPTIGVFQNLGTVTINNRYITASSIIVAGIVAKTNGGGSPDPKNSVYKVDVDSRSVGSCVLRIGMIPFVTDLSAYQGSDYIRLAYVILNPGR